MESKPRPPDSRRPQYLRAKMGTALRKVRNFFRHALQHLLDGDFSGWINRIRAQSQNLVVRDAVALSKRPPARWTFGIMTTPHTEFIASLLKERLQAHGWHADIMTAAPLRFTHDWYVVICPQVFPRLPPRKTRIAFQLEQSVSSRWFSNTYLSILRNSFAVLDYSRTNIAYLADRKITFPHVHYLPIGASPSPGGTDSAGDKDCDVLFYGDSAGSPRRRQMLEALKQRFSVAIVSEVFGQEMRRTIARARVVINLHYYEDGLLEMPRIQECLSLGVPVVSESARDQDDYPELAGAVRFFDQGSIPAMISAVQDILDHPLSEEALTSSVSRSSQRFAFMFDRFLIAQGFLPATHARRIDLPVPASATDIALSLPETVERRTVFDDTAPAGFFVFEGIRRLPGWVGCGLSYMALARHALRNDITEMSIMEDDVLLRADHEARIAVVHEFLNSKSGQWDVFCGVMAALHPETKILSVETYKDIVFVTIDRMTSMVFNIYGKRALQILAAWDPANLDADSNTIDRFLGSQADLRVVVALPFLVSHREDLLSTLRGTSNAGYAHMIRSCEEALGQKAQAFTRKYAA